MHGIIGMGENKPAGIGMRLSVAVPPIDQIGAGLLAALSGMDMAGLFRCPQRCDQSPDAG